MYRRTALEHVEVLDLTTPTYAQVELLSDCNYKCIMCYNVWYKDLKLKRNLNKEDHFKILSILSPHVFSIIFSGGEPTRIPWLPKLVEKTRAENIDTTIITNAALLTKELARDLNNAGLQSAQVSLHHYKSSLSDWITGEKNSVEQTLTGAHNLAGEIGVESIGVCMVANKRTVEDVYAVGEFLHSEGFVNFAVGILSFCGRAALNNLTLSVKDLHKTYKQLESLERDFGMSVGYTGGVPFCVLPNGWKDSPVEIHNACDAAISQIVVGPDGECRPCVEYPFSGGNILEKPLEDIWKSEIFEKIRTFRNIPNLCNNCQSVSECHGGCRAAALEYSGNLCGLGPFLKEVKNDLL